MSLLVSRTQNDKNPSDLVFFQCPSVVPSPGHARSIKTASTGDQTVPIVSRSDERAGTMRTTNVRKARLIGASRANLHRRRCTVRSTCPWLLK
jgi:hypothetical protein